MNKALENEKKKIQEEIEKLEQELKNIDKKIEHDRFKNQPIMLKKFNKKYNGKSFLRTDSDNYTEYCKYSNFRDAGNNNGEIIWTCERIDISPKHIAFSKYDNYAVVADECLLEKRNFASGKSITNDEWETALKEIKQKLFEKGN